jgi:hypothetical protein
MKIPKKERKIQLKEDAWFVFKRHHLLLRLLLLCNSAKGN